MTSNLLVVFLVLSFFSDVEFHPAFFFPCVLIVDSLLLQDVRRPCFEIVLSKSKVLDSFRPNFSTSSLCSSTLL